MRSLFCFLLFLLVLLFVVGVGLVSLVFSLIIIMLLFFQGFAMLQHGEAGGPAASITNAEGDGIAFLPSLSMISPGYVCVCDLSCLTPSYTKICTLCTLGSLKTVMSESKQTILGA